MEREAIVFRVSALLMTALGAHCIVGVRAVVTHRLPTYSVLVGVKAELIKAIDTNTHRKVAVEKG